MIIKIEKSAGKPSESEGWIIENWLDDLLKLRYIDNTRSRSEHEWIAWKNDELWRKGRRTSINTMNASRADWCRNKRFELKHSERDCRVHIDSTSLGRMQFFREIIGHSSGSSTRQQKSSFECSCGVHHSPLHILTNRKFSACLVLHTVRSGFSCSFLHPHSISSERGIARTDESSDGAESSASLWVHHAHEAPGNNESEACGWN